MEITCPSGLRGEIRGMKIKELSLMSDAKLLRSGKLMTEIVKSCWLRTLDFGPYNLKQEPTDALPWGHLLHADQLYVFKQIRVATWGAEFEWEVTCENSSCQHRFLWVLDLNQIPIKQLPETSREFVGTGKLLNTTIDGKIVEFRLLEVNDEMKVVKLNQEFGIATLTAGYMCRIKGVEGIDASDPKALSEWIENLDLAPGLQLQENMDEAEAGVGLRVLIECKRCENTWWTVAPLVQGFSKRKTKKAPPLLKKDETGSTAESSMPPGVSPTSVAPDSPSPTS